MSTSTALYQVNVPQAGYSLEGSTGDVPRMKKKYTMYLLRSVNMNQDIHLNWETVLRCALGKTEAFKVNVGLHQGSALALSYS